MLVIAILIIGGGAFLTVNQIRTENRTRANALEAKKSQRDEDNQYDKFNRYRANAKESMLEYCTNEVVGLNCIISIVLNDSKLTDPYSDNPRDWTGEVVAEYVNHLGGIDRTNCSFRFVVDRDWYFTNITYVKVDLEWMAKERAKKEDADFDAWKKSLNNP